jgi:serine/threonine protein kinase
MSSAAASDLGVLGRYRLVERLGAGGMAVVFRAVIDGPEGFSRDLVVKRMLPAISRNPDFVRLMIDEARLSAKLHHPAIVQIYDFGREGDEYYLAMEYVDGCDLRSLLRTLVKEQKQLPPKLACFLVHEVASALAYAHALRDEHGQPLEIIHRDVSPSNILIATNGAAKLLDFGIAKAAATVRSEKTRTGVVKGKLSYMSPEQADAQPIDRRSDIFALGVVFWECLTAKRLFRGDNDMHTGRLVREAKVAPPSTVVSGIDVEIDAVVMKMVAREPAQRYGNCDEVVAALSPIVHRLAGDANGMHQFLSSLGVAIPRDTEIDPYEVEEQSSVPEMTSARSNGELRPRTQQLEPSRARTALLASASVLVVVAALAVGRMYSRAPAAPAPVVTPAPRAEPVAPAPIAKVHVSLRGLAGAEVQLDGDSVGKLPLDLELPSRAQSRELSVRAPGYESFSASIAGDKDTVLNAALSRVAVKPKAIAKPARKPSARPAAQPAPAAKKSGDIHDPFLER